MRLILHCARFNLLTPLAANHHLDGDLFFKMLLHSKAGKSASNSSCCTFASGACLGAVVALTTFCAFLQLYLCTSHGVACVFGVITLSLWCLFSSMFVLPFPCGEALGLGSCQVCDPRCSSGNSSFSALRRLVPALAPVSVGVVGVFSLAEGAFAVRADSGLGSHRCSA